jgi:hypothetical protein
VGYRADTDWSGDHIRPLRGACGGSDASDSFTAIIPKARRTFVPVIAPRRSENRAENIPDHREAAGRVRETDRKSGEKRER